MSQARYILALDEGTTGTTALVFDPEAREVARAYRELTQIYPQAGWVEQDPREIYRLTLEAADEAVKKSGLSFCDVVGLGITNQRETAIVWERATGMPVHNAVVWQCRRTASLCEDLKSRGLHRFFQERTGLTVDPYFSATKVRWILDNIADGQRRAAQGDLLFGTVDSWLVWNLTGGKVHVTDYSNASRTMLFNIHSLRWDDEILGLFDLPVAMLPRVQPSSGFCGETDDEVFEGSHIPIAGIAGDQQASLFGQACYQTGMAKNTYGTGAFVLVNTGPEPVVSKSGMVTTVAWGLENRTTYALEGSIFIGGAVVQWLRDGLGIIDSSAESEALAASVPDNGGIYFVPAFVGLGAPHWDMYARGTIVGLTQGITKGHLARASLEAIAFQTRDVIDAIRADLHAPIPVLRVDGGGSRNNLLMQFQADILGLPIQRARTAESTALGASLLAALAIGIWKTTSEIEKRWQSEATFEPRIGSDERELLYHDWKRAIDKSRDWAEKH